MGDRRLIPNMMPYSKFDLMKANSVIFIAVKELPSFCMETLGLWPALVRGRWEQERRDWFDTGCFELPFPALH